MSIFGVDGGEDDVQFLKNLRILTTRLSNKNSSSKQRAYSQRALVRSFVHDLCFWDVTEASSYPTKQSSSKRKVKASTGAKATISSTSRSKDRTTTEKERQYQSQRSKSEMSSECEASDPPTPKMLWKTAIDPASGQPYYYHTITRQTQWNKPPELKALEKKKKAEKRRREKEFFSEMEQNIRNSLLRGELIPGIPLSETKKEGPPLEPLPLKTVRVRTISAMDEVLLAELRDDKNEQRQSHQGYHLPVPVAQPHNVNMDKSGRPPLPTARRTKIVEQTMDLSPEEPDAKHGHPLQRYESELAGEKLLDGPIQNECDLIDFNSTSPPTGHTRRNTGGTIYLHNTMMNPDVKATIKCVCGVYRAHIVQATEKKNCRSPTSVIPNETDVFIDDRSTTKKNKKKTSHIPSLDEIVAFYEGFYRRSRMEHDTIIMSLIYVERLVKATNGVLVPSPENWRSVLFSCMVLASKVWDDLSMWNIDFSNVSAATAGLSSFTLPRINELELAVLKCLNFDVKVPASEYAKYYFLIRSMLLRSGLVRAVEKPLGKEEAQKLESRTANYQDDKLVRSGRGRRVKSMGDVDSLSWLGAASGDKPGPVLRDSVCLEQLVG